jgi:cytoskeletal protein RodZ
MENQVRGRDLRQARIDAGLKQSEVEQALGVHHAFLSAIETEQEGVQPSPEFAQRYLVAVENASNGAAA